MISQICPQNHRKESDPSDVLIVVAGLVEQGGKEDTEGSHYDCKIEEEVFEVREDSLDHLNQESKVLKDSKAVVDFDE